MRRIEAGVAMVRRMTQAVAMLDDSRRLAPIVDAAEGVASGIVGRVTIVAS